MEEILKPTQELIDIFDEYQACKSCRDSCINLIFGSRKAIKYAKKAEKTHRKFWLLSEKLHPELKSGVWTYHGFDQVYKPREDD